MNLHYLWHSQDFIKTKHWIYFLSKLINRDEKNL